MLVPVAAPIEKPQNPLPESTPAVGKSDGFDPLTSDDEVLETPTKVAASSLKKFCGSRGSLSFLAADAQILKLAQGSLPLPAGKGADTLVETSHVFVDWKY